MCSSTDKAPIFFKVDALPSIHSDLSVEPLFLLAQIYLYQGCQKFVKNSLVLIIF
jgi:hypothetical protein